MNNTNEQGKEQQMVKHAAVRAGETPSEQSGKTSVRVVNGEALARGETANKEFDQAKKLF